MGRTEILEKIIRMSGYNIKGFSEFAEIPYTTLRSILSRGIGNSSVDNVFRVLGALKITSERLEQLAAIDNEEQLMEELAILTKETQNPDYYKVSQYEDEIEVEVDPDIRTLNRAAKDMSPEQRKKAIRILEATFEDLFDDED